MTTLEQNTSFGSTIEWFKEITPEVYELTKFLEQKEREDFIKYLIKSRKPDCLVNAGSRLIYEMLPEIELANESLCVVDLLFNTEGGTLNCTSNTSGLFLLLLQKVRRFLFGC